MTRSFSPGGVPTLQVADYYVRRAQGEVGLIVSEGTVVDRPASSYDPNIPHFYGEKALSGWKDVIDKVHAVGGVMAPQLWHVGVVNPGASGWLPPGPFEGPSGYVSPGKTGGVAMTESDIADTIRAFAQSAADAKALGFDAVEIHGAHGYLIDQFFWHPTNQRTNGYGGQTLVKRTRFATDLIRAVRKLVGPDFPISLRISQCVVWMNSCDVSTGEILTWWQWVAHYLRTQVGHRKSVKSEPQSWSGSAKKLLQLSPNPFYVSV